MIADFADRQQGVVSRRQLLGAGVGRGAIELRLRNRRLRPLHHGVYAVGHRAVTHKGLLWAAVLATNGVVSHRAAAWLWGILPTSRLVEVTSQARSRRGFVSHRSTLRTDEITVIDGLPVTSFIRTLLDLADVCTEYQLENAINEAEVRRLDFTGLDALLDAAVGRRGVAKLRRARSRYTSGMTRSELERVFLAAVDEAGLPRPRMNAVVEGDEVDAFWPELALIAEIDSHTYHRTARKMATDRARDRRYGRLGYEVLRFMDSDLEHRVADVIRDLSAAARARRAGAWSAARR